LPWELWRAPYAVYLSSISGRFALPITFAIARLKRKPFILWTGIWQRLQTPAHRLFYPLTRYILRSADAVVVYGAHVKRFLVAEGVEPARIFVTTHAVDNSQYNRQVAAGELQTLRHALQIPEDRPVVLYLGRLEPVKGLEYLLEAFAALPCKEAILVLAGSGSAETDLQQRADRLGVRARIRFTGYVPTGETVAYYALAAVFVLPSVTTPTAKETWGLVVNEAFNQGVPVIATDAVGAAAGGLVRHGENGLVVPERDSQALADALHLILSQPALCQDMSHAAKTIIAGWNNERMVDGFRQAIAFATQRARHS
jgi:glycosyltransferase involved in cell wall biosynthesis